MRSGFPGFPAEGMAFFSQPGSATTGASGSSRARRFSKRQVKQPMRELVGAVNAAMKSFAPDYVTDPDKAIYRIYRDTRFSKDKTPYKDHIAAIVSRRRGRQERARAITSRFRTRRWRLAGASTCRSRKRCWRSGSTWRNGTRNSARSPRARACAGCSRRVQGEQLTRVPKGYPCDHPAADLLRMQAVPFVRGAAAGAGDHARAVHAKWSNTFAR